MNNIKIGFWGYPDPTVTEEIKKEYPNAEWVDLDIDFGYEDKKILPESYCKIIKNIINNSLELRPVKIVAPIGKDKCDSGWFAAQVLRDLGLDVIETKYEQTSERKSLVISKSAMPLYDKVNTIMNNLINPVEYDLPEVKPKFGFWGVPPNDLEILKLFPDETHVYGWTRCVEAGTPADIDLEMYVDEDVPTVFYAQAFCSKAQLAKYLADKYNGLYIDIDDYASNSIQAKIEAFLRLR
ncbi:MAG: hypothetical protein K6E29_05725 [Cyanobacteria bacterium RUI128]|nr:hypothetical protein [Cyanobacteria bacterium RUI128]